MHLDLDVIVRKDLDQLGRRNYACAQSSNYIGSAIISFDESDFGRKIGELCLRSVDAINSKSSN